MDPALQRRLEQPRGGDIEAVVRLRGEPPPDVRVVARFGDIATCRIPVDRVPSVYRSESILSIKYPRRCGPELTLSEPTRGPRPRLSDRRRPDDLGPTGRGVVLGIVDWGCDLAHPDLRHADGSTRLTALWDMRHTSAPPRPYGYGTVHRTQQIDAALESEDPARALGYRLPARRDGHHGTHVASIAAGTGAGGGPLGLAPEAELVFVQLGSTESGGLATLGDSVRILEAVDFILRVAGGRPCVINMSVGSQGGSHDGTSAVEIALDNAVSRRPGCVLCQSSGNYFRSLAHAAVDLRPGEVWQVDWVVRPGDPTSNEMEMWYSGLDLLHVTLRSPDGRTAAAAGLDGSADVIVGGQTVGRLYHRRDDPYNHDNHVDCFLFRGAPSGAWRVEVEALDVIDGRVRAWIERDGARPGAQSSFRRDSSSAYGTVGTIATGRRTIAVGAYDPHQQHEPVAPFSSAGPTRDGRYRPDLLAPGVRSLAARSRDTADSPLLIRKSGTSMAAPVVTGTVACMLETNPDLDIATVRNALMSTARLDPHDDIRRYGSGRLDPVAAVRATSRGARR